MKRHSHKVERLALDFVDLSSSMPVVMDPTERAASPWVSRKDTQSIINMSNTSKKLLQLFVQILMLLICHSILCILC